MNDNHTKRPQNNPLWKQGQASQREDSLAANWQQIGDVAARCIERIRAHDD